MKQKTDFLKSAELFKHLSNVQLETIANDATVENYAKDQIIFLKGDPADYMFMVISGWVKGFRTSFNGEDAVFAIKSTYSTFGDIASLGKTNHIATIQAVTPVKMLKIPYHTFLNVLKKDKCSLETMFKINSERHNSLINEIEQLITCKAHERIGLFLLEMLKDSSVTTFPAENSANIKLPYAKSLVAQQLGMKAETFSRSFAKLKSEGLIYPEKRDIKINDINKLKNYCRV